MSMYHDYIKEYTDLHVLETEDGFVTYSISNLTVYIQNIYVKPSLRKSGVASRLADQICALAKEQGCTMLLGSVQPSAKNSTASIQILLAYGMKLMSATNDMIYFKREL